jgi:hypothetical protein
MAYNRIKMQFRNENKSKLTRQSQEALPYIFREAAAKRNSGLYRPNNVEGMIPEFKEQYLRIHADALDPYDYPVLQEHH